MAVIIWGACASAAGRQWLFLRVPRPSASSYLRKKLLPPTATATATATATCCGLSHAKYAELLRLPPP